MHIQFAHLVCPAIQNYHFGFGAIQNTNIFMQSKNYQQALIRCDVRLVLVLEVTLLLQKLVAGQHFHI